MIQSVLYETQDKIRQDNDNDKGKACDNPGKASNCLGAAFVSSAQITLNLSTIPLEGLEVLIHVAMP